MSPTKAEIEERNSELLAELEEAKRPAASNPDEWTRSEAEAFVAECRQPFDDALVGQKPVGVDKNGAKSNCDICGQFLGYHQHIDYVGHAAVQDRLYAIDPMWSWEPMAYDEKGLPAVVAAESGVSLWIKLTVRGVTRIGVGTAPKGKRENTLKLLESDALKRAAMRFGIGIDLWSKEDLAPEYEQSPAPPAETSDQKSDGSDDVLMSDRQVQYVRRRLREETAHVGAQKTLARALTTRFNVASANYLMASDFDDVELFIDKWLLENPQNLPAESAPEAQEATEGTDTPTEPSEAPQGAGITPGEAKSVRLKMVREHVQLDEGFRAAYETVLREADPSWVVIKDIPDDRIVEASELVAEVIAEWQAEQVEANA